MGRGAMLTIVRNSTVADGTRAYKVVLDGVVVGKVKNGETVEFALTPGKHVLHLKIDWCRSDIVEFDSAEGNERYVCGALVAGLIPMLMRPKDYIFLLPSEAPES